jgi:hypothetical protein
MRDRGSGYVEVFRKEDLMTERNDFTGAELDEPLVDDLLDETRRPDDVPSENTPSEDTPAAAPDEVKEQPDPPTTSDVPEPPD